ncbi:MAG: hypothetical protein IKP65_02085 [Alphaproteobacteria bacterium]|nr:hypothetical protein [Alphaproteobacteria bacterium]
MTEQEYLDVCNKYSDYLVYNRENMCYYINRGERTEIDTDFQVTNFNYDDNGYGYGEVYPHCYFEGHDIVSALHPFYKTMDINYFEKKLQLYIKNYKQLLVDLKKEEINKDFV